MITNFHVKDTHTSVLLIGIAKTNKYLMQVVKPESLDEAYEVFGYCNLTNSYAIARNGHEDKDIFILNLETLHDYLDAAVMLREYEFSYIVPIDVYLSDFFYDPTANGRRTYYLQYLLQQLQKGTGTVVLATDEHANLYEDIDAFLDDMAKKRQAFKANALSSEHRENILFVANNLSDVAYGNAVAARMILNSEVQEYPYENVARKAIFEIDFTDNIDDMAYFRNHADGTMTIENLLNMYDGESPIKIFQNYRICIYIGKELDFDEQIGSVFVSYKKQKILMDATAILNSFQGKLLEDYKINDVYAEEDWTRPGTVKVVLKYALRPIGCTERFINRVLTA